MEYITLNDGNKIPVLGLGVYKVTNLEECEEAVLTALKIGYRMIDTAEAYFNEEAVGRAIKRSGVPREEIFITTKIHFQWADNALEEVKKSLEKLQTDYIDLLLLHWPYGNYYHAYRVMQDLKKAGVARSIGVSNFGSSRLVDLIHFNDIVPAVNQIEAHLYCQRHHDAAFNRERGIAVEAYSPLGRADKAMFEEPIVKAIASKYNKTPAQVMLRYLTQLGYIIIPKSVHEDRMRENFEIFDFRLDEEEMSQMKSLDQDHPISGISEDEARALHLIEGKKW